MLITIGSKNIKEQFGIINMAINSVHQTGDMMEYYENLYGVAKTDFTQLSNMDRHVTNFWNKELREMGIDIAEGKQETFKTFVN